MNLMESFKFLNIQGYVGERNELGQRDGFGRTLLPNGDQYEGQYRDGFRHGKGTYQFVSGAQYSGDWKKNAKHGNGKFNFPDGSSYCGNWKDNKMHGLGKYSYSNGDIYEGTWKDNVRHGIGNYKFSLVDLSIRALWVEGVPKGPIEAFFPDYRYYGQWNKSEPVGRGTFTFGGKYMLSGHIEQFPDLESFEAFRFQSPLDDVKCLPQFVAGDIELYDESKLNRESISIPPSGSMTSFCSSSSTSENLSQSVDILTPSRTITDSMKGIAGSMEENLQSRSSSSMTQSIKID